VNSLSSREDAYTCFVRIKDDGGVKPLPTDETVLAFPATLVAQPLGAIEKVSHDVWSKRNDFRRDSPCGCPPLNLGQGPRRSGISQAQQALSLRSPIPQ